MSKEQNPRFSPNAIDDLLDKMTLEEKASLVNGATFFGTCGIERLGIPPLMLLDGGTGINFEQLFGDFCSKEEISTNNSTNGMSGSSGLARVIEDYYHPERLDSQEMELHAWIKERLDRLVGGEYSPGCFPCGMMLGASFEPEIVYNVGVSLGKEARLFGIDMLLGSPYINLHRDPLNGRLFEGLSEDPHLISCLAPEMVKGVQKCGVAANVKHFAANNQETNRVGINETISERALHELYLPGFKACVQNGGVKTVMSAYNAINGVPCSENRWLLNDMLRDSWGFDGVVVSDWGAVYHPVEALSAGNDLAMPGPISGEPIVDAVKNGKLSEEELNKAVKRMLGLILFCTGTREKTPAKEFEQLRAVTSQAAYEAARAGTVMLKNREHLYPLSDNGAPVVIFGSGARQLVQCGTGSAGITTDRTSSLEQSLKSVLSRSEVIVSEEIIVDRLLQQPGCRVVFVASLIGMEGNDRQDMFLAENDRMQLDKLCVLKQSENFTLTLVLNVCGPVDISDYEESLDAVFVCFLPGMEGARALGDIMTGQTDPSGRLPISFPKHYEDAPTALGFPGDGKQVNYGEGIFVGYRYYDKKKLRPAYPFGSGLSYTTFEYSDLTLESDEFTDELRGFIEVENTGKRAGTEVVQLYVSDPVSTLPKPVKELKFFRKIHLQPGERKRVDFVLEEKAFASYDPDYGMWLAEEGYYDIIAASSSAAEDVRQTRRVYLRNCNQYSFGLHTTVKIMYEKAELKEALRKLWNSHSWDWQIIESNYQYTPNRRLSDVFPEPPTERCITVFLEDIASVRHE